MSAYVGYLTFLSAQDEGTVVEDADGDQHQLVSDWWYQLGSSFLRFTPVDLASYGPFKLIVLPPKKAAP